MTHLSPREFVDEIDGRLAGDRRSHLDACAACAERMTVLRDAIADARGIGIPEPSPLFWDHFSARVRAALPDAPPQSRTWWRHPAWAVACSILLVAAVVLGVRDARTPRAAATLPAAAAAVDGSAADDPAWNLLTDVASGMERQDLEAAPATLRPAEIDRAIGDLSAAERQELRRLLQDEMKRSGD